MLVKTSQKMQFQKHVEPSRAILGRRTTAIVHLKTGSSRYKFHRGTFSLDGTRNVNSQHLFVFLTSLKNNSQTCPGRSHVTKNTYTFRQTRLVKQHHSSPECPIHLVHSSTSWKKSLLSFAWIKHLLCIAGVFLSWRTEGLQRSSLRAWPHNDALLHTQTSRHN